MLRFILFVFALAIFSYGQDKGYSDLPWGSKPDLMKSKYQNAKDTIIKYDNMIHDFIDYPAEGSIISRTFEYWNNKLCKVIVVYQDRNNIVSPSLEFSGKVLAVANDIGKKYGKVKPISSKALSLFLPNDALMIVSQWDSKSIEIQGATIINVTSGTVYMATFTYSSKKYINEYLNKITNQKPEY